MFCKYITKPRTVEAVKFWSFDRDRRVPKDIVEFLGPGTIAGYDGEAKCLKIYIGFDLNAILVPEKHHIVRHHDGRLEIMTESMFKEFYQEAPKVLAERSS